MDFALSTKNLYIGPEKKKVFEPHSREIIIPPYFHSLMGCCWSLSKDSLAVMATALESGNSGSIS